MALPSVGIPLLLLNGVVAFGLNVAGVFLIGAAGSLVLTLSGILKVGRAKRYLVVWNTSLKYRT